MNGLLASAISEYLRHLPTERHFDAAMLAMLRLEGFHDIHFIHGVFEFGKDFIAKRDDAGIIVQCAFQSKLGDVGKTSWERDVRPQCETMAISELAHIAFDPSVPQRRV